MLITSGRSPFLGKYKVMCQYWSQYFDWITVQHHNSLSPAFFLQVGYMNDGTILATDITYYSNGGCTLDESSFVC